MINIPDTVFVWYIDKSVQIRTENFVGSVCTNSMKGTVK